MGFPFRPSLQHTALALISRTSIRWEIDMPLVVQRQQLNLGQTTTFSFPDPIPPGYYAVGLSYFGLSYTWPPSYVRRLSVSLSHGQQDQKTVYVTFNADMVDDSGHSVDPKSINTTCVAAVIAWTGSSDSPTLHMQNMTGVSSSNPKTVSLPTNALVAYTFLSGLDLELPQAQGVTSLSASSSANIDAVDSTISITGGSVLNGVQGTADVGLLVTTAAQVPYQLSTMASVNQQPGNVQFNPSVSAVVLPMISFDATGSGEGLVNVAIGSLYNNVQTFPTVNAVTGNPGANIYQQHNLPPPGNINTLVLGTNST
jgi:hypothetical protein